MTADDLRALAAAAKMDRRHMGRALVGDRLRSLAMKCETLSPQMEPRSLGTGENHITDIFDRLLPKMTWPAPERSAPPTW